MDVHSPHCCLRANFSSPPGIGHTKARPTTYNNLFRPHHPILFLVPQTSIPIESTVRDRLKTFGHAGMNYSEIVTAVLDKIEREAFVREMRRIANDPSTKWVDHKDIKWD